MYSIAFPNMFNSSRTYLVKDKEATASNLHLLVKTAKKSLFGDPDFGNDLDEVLFQNLPIIQDLLIDEIYTAITLYLPQVAINRNEISIEQIEKEDGTQALLAHIKVLNRLDYTTNMYNINLTDKEE